MKTSLISLFAFFAAFCTSASAQNAKHFCGFENPEVLINLRTDISSSEKARLIEQFKKTEAQIKEQTLLRSQSANKRNKAPYIIPVVFHIMHNYGIENISAAQVKDALRVLNDDFNQRNDQSGVFQPFKGYIGNAQVEFRLATRDTNGNCTNGILRHSTDYAYIGVHAFGLKPELLLECIKQQWPATKYLNIFVIPDLGPFAGFVYSLPSSLVLPQDGLFLAAGYTGSIGVSPPSNQYVITHEAGHWLGLWHTWGPTNSPGQSTNCDFDDFVYDTPNCMGVTVCDSTSNTCGAAAPNDTIDNVQNFMEYSYCCNMFTKGQALRMQSFLDTIPERRNLWQPANLVATGADYNPANPPSSLCKIEFMPSPSIACVGATVTYTDYSFNGVTSWNWTFEGAIPATSTSPSPIVTYPAPGQYKTTLSVSNGSTTLTKNEISVTIVIPDEKTIPYQETFSSLASLATEFNVNDRGLDKTWELSTAAGYNDTKSACIKSFLINYDNTKNPHDELITQSFDATGNPGTWELRYKYAFAGKFLAGNSDILEVYYNNCESQRWILIDRIETADLGTAADEDTKEFIPAGQHEWKSRNILLSTSIGKGVRFKFDYTYGGGNNLYLDNINIDFTNANTVSRTSTLNLKVIPNPAESTSELRFSLENPATVEIALFDMLGKKAYTVTKNILPAGAHSIPLSVRRGGVYILELSVDGEKIQRKVIFNN